MGLRKTELGSVCRLPPFRVTQHLHAGRYGCHPIHSNTLSVCHAAQQPPRQAPLIAPERSISFPCLWQIAVLEAAASLLARRSQLRGNISSRRPSGPWLWAGGIRPAQSGKRTRSQPRIPHPCTYTPGGAQRMGYPRFTPSRRAKCLLGSSTSINDCLRRIAFCSQQNPPEG
jgi:hypothetical protein